MSKVIERVINLSQEIEEFPLGHCSPSDDPDKITAYLFSFKDLVKRFFFSAQRVDDNELQKMLERLDLEPEFITEAYDLKANLQGIIDYISDSLVEPTKSLSEKRNISDNDAKKFSQLIQETLIAESANILPKLCENLGLEKGTIDEAFKSKRNYVYSRLVGLGKSQILDLAIRVNQNYDNTQLTQFLTDLNGTDGVNIISQFDKIQDLIIQEITDAKYTIWIAVAWFTNADIANALFLKKKEGLNVQIILNDDKINSKLKDKLNNHFEIYWTSKTSLMHNKFCVIDFNTVIHGSYNWTVKAQYNKETISLIKSIRQAKEFSNEFIRIKKGLIK
ncbi:PLD-like domain-containing protein [Reichenbachiella agariperforans]|uniref:phospholipase D n=1 Tax=Reichenbachiella agariperforans TaxID=156994 RepID=A0A1M6WGV6_REIAG|nr:phospholipase D-like domain-containing protein [Reichenbachiella agariperforans]SHK92755.1 PLD-like domain-containing protein [Reichenbachiella agariperforans]